LPEERSRAAFRSAVLHKKLYDGQIWNEMVISVRLKQIIASNVYDRIKTLIQDQLIWYVTKEKM
jgi:hypothetical protein